MSASASYFLCRQTDPDFIKKQATGAWLSINGAPNGSSKMGLTSIISMLPLLTAKWRAVSPSLSGKLMRWLSIKLNELSVSTPPTPSPFVFAVDSNSSSILRQSRLPEETATWMGYFPIASVLNMSAPMLNLNKKQNRIAAVSWEDQRVRKFAFVSFRE